MRHRRMYRSNAVYELCFRTRTGLPLPPRPLLNMIIRSALARTQRNKKVVLSKHVWMGNHPHILVMAKNINELTRFHEELKKRITDSIKKLLGKKYLNLWQGRTMVAEILDLDKAIERIAYMYLNPSTADLVESVGDYPGVCSWKHFLTCPPSIGATIEEEVPWVRVPILPKLPSAQISKKAEKRMVRELSAAAQERHILETQPFAWLKAFDITDPEEIERVRARIVQRVADGEKENRRRRRIEKKNVFGLDALENMSLDAKHLPKKRSPNIFCLSSIQELRIAFIEAYRAFCARCVEAFEASKAGLAAQWPPEAFVPALPASQTF